MIAVVGFVVWSRLEYSNRTDRPEAIVEYETMSFYYLNMKTCTYGISHPGYSKEGDVTMYLNTIEETQNKAQECLDKKQVAQKSYCITNGPKNYDEYVVCWELKAKD